MQPPPHPTKQVTAILTTRLRQAGDQKKSDQGPRSLVALVAESKGGFAEILHGDQGPKARMLWLSAVLAVHKVGRVQAKAIAGVLAALAAARRPRDIALVEELHDVLPALLADTTAAYVGGVWRPAIQVGGWFGGRGGLCLTGLTDWTE